MRKDCYCLLNLLKNTCIHIFRRYGQKILITAILHLSNEISGYLFFLKKVIQKKIARAIASELDVEAEDVKGAKLDRNALVFLGSGCYAGKPTKSMTNFIQDNDFRSRNIALFGTSASGAGKEVKEMERALGIKEVAIKGTFFCKGKFMFLNRGRPNEEDLKGAEAFAKQMAR